jgi:hypothetical protein
VPKKYEWVENSNESLQMKIQYPDHVYSEYGWDAKSQTLSLGSYRLESVILILYSLKIHQILGILVYWDELEEKIITKLKQATTNRDTNIDLNEVCQDNGLEDCESYHQSDSNSSTNSGVEQIAFPISISYNYQEIFNQNIYTVEFGF